MKYQHTWSIFKIGLFMIMVASLIGGYEYLSSTEEVEAQNVTAEAATSSTTTPTNVVDKDIANTLDKIDNITLDNSIFTDQVYQSLQDYTVILQEEPTGRPNPFAPYAEAPAPQKTSTKNTKSTTKSSR